MRQTALAGSCERWELFLGKAVQQLMTKSFYEPMKTRVKLLMKPLAAVPVCLICALAGLSPAGCVQQAGVTTPNQTAPPAPQAIAPASRAKPTLAAAMDDNQILRALGLDPSKVVVRVTHGKDGATTEYSAGEGTSDDNPLDGFRRGGHLEPPGRATDVAIRQTLRLRQTPGASS